MPDESKPEGAPPAPESAKQPIPKPAEGGSAEAPTLPAAKPPAKRAAPKAPPTMQTLPWEGELPDAVKAKFGDQILEALTYLGQAFFVIQPGTVIPLLDYLKLEKGFDYLVDVTAVDWPDKPERFELVYIVYSFARNERIRIKTRVKEGARPGTAVNVHLTANWLEREVFDMFGIEFEGHPDMKRILLPDEWKGHPLRKDVNILQMDNEWVKENLGIESGQ
jgi:NADH-quinone oxidoreductase subunit C